VNKVRTSKVWVIDETEFRNAIKTSPSYAEVARRLGYTPTGVMNKILKKRCAELGIPESERLQGERTVVRRGCTLESVLVEGSFYNRSTLKARLIKEGLLKNECAECGIGPEWRGKKLVLILDHINGVNDDNRLGNLQLVCPNCNSQLETFGARNKRAKPVTAKCNSCSKVLSHATSTRCKKCHGNEVHKTGANRKVLWPSYPELIARIEGSTRSQVARELGVSETAVRKMLSRMEQSEGMAA
jgi:Zn finger protein HypA/HybF involved in hydrogenase expression